MHMACRSCNKTYVNLQSHFLFDLAEATDGEIEVFLRVAGGDLRADAVATLRDDGIAEADDIHALFKHPAGKLLRDFRVIEHDGDDGVLAGEQIEAELEAAEHEEKIAAPEKEYGVVAVCAGAGMEALFQELGADAIVTGGQTMNPSTNDILKEINRTPASTVFVFPNNKNIIMAAEQCVPLTEKKVVVMPTKTVPQGISALLNFNPENSEEQLEADMKEAISHVHTAMVTYAARDSDFDGHIIHAGEYLALMDGALLGSYTNIKTLFKELSWAFDEIAPEFITVYYGKDVQEDDAQEAAKTIIDCFPDAEVSVVSGGQPVYYYMISVE